jgi:hypothetical protein
MISNQQRRSQAPPRSRVWYANVVATVALFVALGGTSYAALTITGDNVKDSSLRGVDVKNSSLTTSDVKNASLLSSDFKPGQLPAGPQGPQGPKGDPGEKGAKGEKGDAGATNLTRRAGTQVTVNAGSAAAANADCEPGERATGGGAFSSRNDAWLSSSMPVGNPPTGWSVVLRSPAGNAQLTAYVICAAP